MEELKSCPFCGGEAIGFEWSDDDEREDDDPHADYAYCSVDVNHKADCIFEIGEFQMWIASTEKEAAKIWNTRAERTCHMVEAYCSECGKPDPSNGDANYCAYCGAKIIPKMTDLIGIMSDEVVDDE